MPGIQATQTGGAGILNSGGALQNAGPYYTAITNVPILFTAGGTSPTAFTWGVSGPVGNTATLSTSTGAAPVLTGTLPGQYTVSLTDQNGVVYTITFIMVQVAALQGFAPYAHAYLAPSQVATPPAGVTLFADSTNSGQLTQKDSAGVVQLVANTATAQQINNVRVPWKGTARVVATASISPTGGQTIDGVSLVNGDRVLRAGDGSGNGIWVVASGAWARAADMASSADCVAGSRVNVSEGTQNANSIWYLATQGAVNLGSTSLNFQTSEPFINVRRFGAKADGATDDGAAITAAGVVSGDVNYPPGTYSIGTNTTLSAGATHVFARGAILQVANGVALTVAGRILAEPNQTVFTYVGSGNVNFSTGSNEQIHIGWFGAKGDGTVDDAIGINRAANVGNTSGMEVSFHTPPQGYFDIRSKITVGSAVSDSQGVRWKFRRNNYSSGNLADFLCTVSLATGSAVLELISITKFELDGCNIDAAALADYCVQLRSTTGHFPSWHAALTQCTFRNARVHNVLSGDVDLEPSVSGTTFTSTGHPLANDDQVYFWKVLRSSVLPSGGALDALYFVVNKAANTFQISATQGGAAINFADSGSGRWLISKVTTGDCSVPLITGVQFGNNTNAAAHTISHFCQKGYQTFETAMIGCWFQGSMSVPGFGMTAVAATDVVTAAGGTWANGDCVLVWPNTLADTLPVGLVRDTEYWVVNQSGLTFKLAATQGGAPIDITLAGVGSCSVAKLAYPYYGANIHEGTINFISCAGTVMYVDVLATGRKGSQGNSGNIQMKSQSHRLFETRASGLSMSPQEGGWTMLGCEHGDPLNAATNSVIWEAIGPTSLVIVGGQFYKNINLGATSAPCEIKGAQLLASSFYTAGVTGTNTKLAGRWIENSAEVSRFPRIDLAGPVVVDSTHGLVVTNTQLAGTGAAAGIASSITAQQGQQQTGGSANNNGADIVWATGLAGTGGAGAAGVAGTFHLKIGATDQFDVDFDKMFLHNSVNAAASIPTPVSGFYIFVDASDGKLKAKGVSATVTTLALP